MKFHFPTIFDHGKKTKKSLWLPLIYMCRLKQNLGRPERTGLNIVGCTRWFQRQLVAALDFDDQAVCGELCKWRWANHAGSVSFRFANWLCVSFMLSLRDVLPRQTCFFLDFIQITPLPIWTTCTTFLRRRNSRFERQFRTKSTICTILRKKLLYWPKMHLLKM